MNEWNYGTTNYNLLSIIVPIYDMVKEAHAADWPLGTASVSLKLLLCTWQKQQGVFWLVLVFDNGLIYPGPEV